MIYFCPTPIGNLSDITYRTVEVLERVTTIACEDTRVTQKLLNHLQIKKKLISYHKFNERQKAASLVALGQEEDVAVVSDAGMPGISDPGAVLVEALIEAGVDFEVLPGANAALTALVSSGLSTEHFLFYGFLDAKEGKRREQLESLKALPFTLIFYEAPHRIYKTLSSLYEVLGPRHVSVSRELTKLYESHYRFRLGEDTDEIADKGEFVIVVEGSSDVPTYDVKAMLQAYMDEGMRPSQAVKAVAKATNLPKNTIYEMSLELKEKA
ncbi:16S rRNA (cytidine(1402)-2'-O)-methyltransferase [Peptoniphilus equinus]|uniref:Ribosomal RNA small subunit methyltransferase I n=1 Tax=Peptoniphilus equinus TaxID=3016343 RepID=A0ABY7QW76_9FIRM|nr:16S rRNA (cytidine(1402)-2'-O)-methyltransferase [Peptoniphilus equinus]WBW50520.1 16S rRNA (cytidine(1402)-2'-O)-methyltransferase [Peptoniphilus equinus]